MPGPWPLDDGTVDRIVSGLMSADDAPPGYRDAIQLVEALRAQASAEEVRSADVVAADLTAEIRRRSVFRPHTRLRLAVATTVCVSVAFGSLAAAGALPRPAQSLTSTVLDEIGVSVPAPKTGPTGQVDAPSTPGSGGEPATPPSDGGGHPVSVLAPTRVAPDTLPGAHRTGGVTDKPAKTTTPTTASTRPKNEDGREGGDQHEPK
jgi:hypothetical protein